MECPICYQKKSSKYTFRLECGHTICVSCTIKWILTNSCCPCCRQKSFLFFRNTRSQKRAYEIYFETNITWIFLRDYFSEMYSIETFIHMFLQLLERFILKEDRRQLWYRPEMKRLLADLNAVCKLMKRHQMSYPHHEYDILDRFVQLFDISL